MADLYCRAVFKLIYNLALDEALSKGPEDCVVVSDLVLAKVLVMVLVVDDGLSDEDTNIGYLMVDYDHESSYIRFFPNFEEQGVTCGVCRASLARHKSVTWPA